MDISKNLIQNRTDCFTYEWNHDEHLIRTNDTAGPSLVKQSVEFSLFYRTLFEALISTLSKISTISSI